MRGFQNFILKVFSIIVIVIALFSILSATQMIDSSFCINKVINVFLGNKMIVLIVGAIFALFGLIGLFASSDSGEDMRGGLAIKTEKGTVYITKDTFESIIVGVTRNYPELRNVKANISINEKGVIVNVYTMILPDTVVPTLTARLQESIKSSVQKQTTVEINEVNVKIKGVYVDPQKK